MEQEKLPTSKGKKSAISVSLIASRNIVNTKELSADQIADDLLKLTHVRLDRENIEYIDNLDCLGPVTNLYLQCNNIRTIENLDVLTNLRFLMLAENKIWKIENLKFLNNLMFLDLSDNQIEDFDPEELPKSLVILNLSGNPCAKDNDYRSKLLKPLENLEQLDGKTVSKEDRKACGCTVDESDSEEEDEDYGEKGQDDNVTGTDLNQHCNDILVRAKIRRMKEDADHEKRLDEIADMRTDAINSARRAREDELLEKKALKKIADAKNSAELDSR